MGNAIRDSPAHGTIYLTVGIRQQQIYLHLENEGQGLDQALISRLGERFYRSLGSQTTGSGLGLSICKKIMQLHQADMQFSASGYGGLKVELYFRK